jgi:hypothetical protein
MERAEGRSSSWHKAGQYVPAGVAPQGIGDPELTPSSSGVSATPAFQAPEGIDAGSFHAAGRRRPMVTAGPFAYHDDPACGLRSGWAKSSLPVDSDGDGGRQARGGWPART